MATLIDLRHTVAHIDDTIDLSRPAHSILLRAVAIT
jgi:hypothetical protein